MAAPKGNRFALGLTTSGRPPIYENPEQMMQKAIEYFDIETGANGICKPTISGLIFHLGFEKRQSWYDYKERSQEFSYTIDRLKSFIESCYEKNLHGFAYAGSVFALKNLNSKDWKDEVHSEVNQTNRNITVNFGSNTIQPAQESTPDTQ